MMKYSERLYDTVHSFKALLNNMHLNIWSTSVYLDPHMYSSFHCYNTKKYENNIILLGYIKYLQNIVMNTYRWSKPWTHHENAVPCHEQKTPCEERGLQDAILMGDDLYNDEIEQSIRRSAYCLPGIEIPRPLLVTARARSPRGTMGQSTRRDKTFVIAYWSRCCEPRGAQYVNHQAC